jgi:hypothetical protein
LQFPPNAASPFHFQTKLAVHRFEDAKLKEWDMTQSRAPWKVIVKSTDTTVQAQRKAAAERVIADFGNRLPSQQLLCFFDDKDFHELKQDVGKENRGLYSTIKVNGFLFWTDERWGAWPDYVKECIVVDDQRVFDHIIYLHGSACSNEVGLTMTFAHELQHFIQHESALRLWAANTLVPNLPRPIIKALGLTWCDLPVEREARIVSKRTAESLFGVDVVRLYIEEKVAEFVTPADAADWECIRDLGTSAPYDLEGETKLFFPRLKNCRRELESVLQNLRSNDPDFHEVDLDALLDGA